jgi:endothelin-converting enzyme/putative endopeptidase
MIHNIILAYQNRINNLTWMSAETKVKAVEKLNKIHHQDIQINGKITLN